jgi:hypothetical protein
MEDVLPTIKRNTPSVEEIKEMDRVRNLGLEATNDDIFVSSVSKLEVVEPKEIEEPLSPPETNAETHPISAGPPLINKEDSSESTFCPESPK